MSIIIDNFKNKRQNYGKKGNNLRILMELFKNNKSVFVPETLVLPNSLFKKIIKENDNADFSDYKNIFINPQIENEILRAVRGKFNNCKLVIRSSASCEDSIFFSGSGQYDSFLNIESDEQIIDAIKKVYASFFSKNSYLYSKIYNINLKKESMAVLIQPVAPVVKAGVMFSCNPVDNSKKYIIESTKGLGTNVVEGTGDIAHLEIDYKDKNLIKDKETILLLNTIDDIRKEFGYDVDVEWGITDDGKLYIFQTRPIVFKNIKFDIYYNDSIVTYKCTPISLGFSIGKIENITNKSNCEILYQNEKYDFNDFNLLLSSRGVILNENAKLSHFANILRELVKPCVFVDNFKFKKNNLYVVDAFNGNIIDFNNLKASEKVDLMFENFNYMKSILNVSFEKHNGILNIRNDDKYEEVVFDIDERKVIEGLLENGFKRKIIYQKIYTYDFPDKALINNNAIFRIQISNGVINIQLKQLDTTNTKYRKEKGLIINFDSLKNAKKFMDSYLMVETGYQERRIIKYEKDDVSVNIIKWPGCEPYLGIEGNTLGELNKVNDKLKLNKYLITGFGGKQIFDKLNLTLTDCKFDSGEK